jgi:thiamine pyrophosphate-dependent acetolactate synthase large subunit-like protein
MSVTVGQFLVQLLAANGIETVFGIPGVHNLEAYRGIASSNLRHILVRHEQGAGFAADGHARAGGGVAAAFVISGPGLTNILTAIGQAYSDSVPVLVIASTPARATLGKRWGVLHELRNQQLLASGIFGVTRAARSATDVRDHLRACLASLRSGRTRPAYLEVPLDLLAETTTLVAERFSPPSPPPMPAARQVAIAIENLGRAERPLLIVGGGACGAANEVLELVECLDAYVASTAAGKGIVPEDHPANLGASLPYAPTQALAAAADVILAIGTELSETDIYTGFRLPRGGRMIRVDVDPAKLADAYAAEVPIWGDARLTAGAIRRGLETRRGWRSAQGPASAVRATIEAQFTPQMRSLQRAIAALQAGLPDDAIVFSDMTQIAYFGNYAFRSDAPGRWHHPSGYGTLGFALPAALGGKIASPARAVVALAGDFGLQFTLGELMTAVEARVSLPVVVWNNAALGQIRDDMHSAGIPPTGVIGQNPDFQLLARSYGAAATQVRDAAALTTAVRAALSEPRPTLIEIVAADFTANP